MRTTGTPNTSDIDRIMLENAADYLRRSIQGYLDDDYKGALIFLWSGLLLFMKLRLFRVNPVLIYERLEEIVAYDPTARAPKYATFDTTGDRHTANYSAIKQRMKWLSIESAVLEADGALSRLQKLRNRIEHYVDDVPKSAYAASIDAVLPFLTTFVEDELDERLAEIIPNWEELLSIDAFYKDRVGRMRDYVAARQYSAAADGDDLLGHPCPNCSDGEMTAEDTDDGEKLTCRVCGFASAFGVCTRCGRVVIEHDWSSMLRDIRVCEQCFEDCMNKDDYATQNGAWRVALACPISGGFDNRPRHGPANLRRQGMVSDHLSQNTGLSSVCTGQRTVFSLGRITRSLFVGLAN